MLCQVPVDYHLKQSKISYEIKSALTLADEIIIEGVSKLNNRFDMTASVTVISPPANWLNLEICDLLIHWQPSTTYKFRFSQDFYRDSDNQPNPQFDITYTTNPLPAIVSANPAFNATNVTNNTKIVLNFDRKMRYGEQGTKNIYLYEVASPSDILVDTYTNDDVTLSPDGASVTISTLGAIKANTQYYLLIEGGIYRDYDNFSLPAVTDPAFYTFRTDESEDDFPDLITIQFVTGDLYSNTQFARLRTPSSTFEIIDVNLFVYDQYRYRGFRGNFTVETDIYAKWQYNKGSLRSSISSQADLFANWQYNKGSLRSSISSDALLNSSVGVIKRLLSSISADATLSLPNTYRIRNIPSSISAQFDESCSIDYGMLSSTRANITDLIGTVSINNGPILLDKRGPTNPISYTLTITPSQQPTNLGDMYLNSTFYNIASDELVAYSGRSSTLANNWSDGTEAGRDVTFARDGNYFAIFIPKYTYSPTTQKSAIYEKSGNTWQYHSLLDGQIRLNKDATVAISNTGVYFRSSGTTWTLNNTFSRNLIALNADGNTVVMLGSTSNSFEIFYYNGTSWVSQGTISETGIVTGVRRTPNKIDFSDDGNTLVIGGDNNTNNIAGKIYVYVRSGSTWTKQQELQWSRTSINDNWGEKVAISGDGNTIATTDFNYTITAPSVTIFTRNGSVWGEETIIDFVNHNNLSVDLSRDGNHLITSTDDFFISGSGTTQGRMSVWSRWNTTWSEKYSDTQVNWGNPSSLNFGASCSIDGAATQFIVGRPDYNQDQGAVNLYNGPGIVYETNVSTKIMTIRGQKQQISNAIEYILMNRNSAGNGTFTLTYTATRSTDGFVSIRFQNITY